MYQIHHLEQSRSHRIVWLAEELGIDYELITYKRNPKTLCAPSQLQEVHPIGKVPILVHDGQAISESGVIINYLLDRLANTLRPPFGTSKYDTYRQWLYFAEGIVMPILFARLVLSRVITAPEAPTLFRPLTKKILTSANKEFFHPELQRIVHYITEHLTRYSYFTGEQFSAADIQMAYPILAICQAHGNPILEEWLVRVSERPAQQRAAAKGAGIDLPNA